LPVPGQSASEAAYRDIKGWILSGDIPLGMRLGEGRVAARLSTSRTPVREALLRLYAERFVERHPEGGYRINHPTARAMHELYDVRRALELFAIRSAAANALDTSHPAHAQLIELRDEWLELAAEAPDGDAGFVVTDEDFHSRLAGASGNAELVEALNRVCERIRPVRAHDFIWPDESRRRSSSTWRSPPRPSTAAATPSSCSSSTSASRRATSRWRSAACSSAC